MASPNVPAPKKKKVCAIDFNKISLLLNIICFKLIKATVLD